jgi:Transglycosylase SLT domain
MRRRAGRERTRRFRLPTLWPGARERGRWWHSFRRASLITRVAAGSAVVLALWLATNWIYQVVRKPSELFFPVSGALYKTPAETWRQYSPIFRKHATSVITPTLLAAIAQVEGSGNPLVRTYWRWSWTSQAFEIYRPASSAVGMYQITDGTFAEARRYCIHDHRVVQDGQWDDWRSCWFNRLYARVVPSHAVELTAAYLHRNVEIILERHQLTSAPLQQKQDLAAVIHLCGAHAGDDYADHHFQLREGQRCGDHDVRAYLVRMNLMKGEFYKLAAEASGGAQ